MNRLIHEFTYREQQYRIVEINGCPPVLYTIERCSLDSLGAPKWESYFGISRNDPVSWMLFQALLQQLGKGDAQ